MITTAVESTTLATVTYDPNRQVLRLGFHSAAVYDYFDVPSDVYQALIAAESKGSFFNRNIRGRFSYHRLTD
jgi:hypothetical protein